MALELLQLHTGGPAPQLLRESGRAHGLERSPVERLDEQATATSFLESNWNKSASNDYASALAIYSLTYSW
jgi:hypothetical protein